MVRRRGALRDLQQAGMARQRVSRSAEDIREARGRVLYTYTPARASRPQTPGTAHFDGSRPGLAILVSPGHAWILCIDGKADQAQCRGSQSTGPGNRSSRVRAHLAIRASRVGSEVPQYRPAGGLRCGRRARPSLWQILRRKKNLPRLRPDACRSGRRGDHHRYCRRLSRSSRVEALAAGKHVLCEKPIGIAVEEVEELEAAVGRSGRILQIGHMLRFDPGIESSQALHRHQDGGDAGAQGMVLRQHASLCR